MDPPVIHTISNREKPKPRGSVKYRGLPSYRLAYLRFPAPSFLPVQMASLFVFRDELCSHPVRCWWLHKPSSSVPTKGNHEILPLANYAGISCHQLSFGADIPGVLTWQRREIAPRNARRNLSEWLMYFQIKSIIGTQIGMLILAQFTNNCLQHLPFFMAIRWLINR